MEAEKRRPSSFKEYRNYLIVIFANIAVIKKVKLENTLLPFMKENSYLNVTNVITSVIIRDEQAC